MTTKEFFEREEAATKEDKWMGGKVEYMYDYLDYGGDRAQVRGKFLREMNKRVTLDDIGETLDKLVIESKAANWKHYDAREHWNK